MGGSRLATVFKPWLLRHKTHTQPALANLGLPSRLITPLIASVPSINRSSSARELTNTQVHAPQPNSFAIRPASQRACVQIALCRRLPCLLQGNSSASFSTVAHSRKACRLARAAPVLAKSQRDSTEEQHPPRGMAAARLVKRLWGILHASDEKANHMSKLLFREHAESCTGGLARVSSCNAQPTCCCFFHAAVVCTPLPCSRPFLWGRDREGVVIPRSITHVADRRPLAGSRLCCP